MTAPAVDTRPTDTDLRPETVAAARRLPCRVSDPDLWFADNPTDLEQAKALCGACPLREACLAEALARNEPWGVWGGEILEQGIVIARKRPRGRPRKNPVAA
ncbi:WhiB family transcriptional regulator [Williamsia deligens]|uniref:Transcriptional regulator WhiB n=1 Tax=Williamsia deligens TaxID=321325 RepID=A0ABW3G261_9NOCA|nr:WhiB family transcriptional regulator [Williamsia deligens]MCP2194848.1 WhiB family transcriptional regulator, redox-sensing transcriptional regulator [Williamsia deligens]